ncbi:hypothetical protein Tco_0852956 [Tanacetum coccineum]
MLQRKIQTKRYAMIATLGAANAFFVVARWFLMCGSAMKYFIESKTLRKRYLYSNKEVVEYSFWKFHEVKCQIETSMLSLGTMYEVSLIFKFPEQPNVDLKSVKLITVKWRKEELNICSTDMVELASNNWSSVKMWRFINHGPNAEFDVVIDGFSYPEFPNISLYGLLIYGIEFQSIEMASFYLLERMIIYLHEVIEGFKSLWISDEKDVDNDDDDEYSEKKLPDGRQHYIEMSDKPLNHTTKKKLYFLLCVGFLADNGHLKARRVFLVVQVAWFRAREA